MERGSDTRRRGGMIPFQRATLLPFFPFFLPSSSSGCSSSCLTGSNDRSMIGVSNDMKWMELTVMWIDSRQ